jgi:ribonucleoside-diphosphate reductase alpha chain
VLGEETYKRLGVPESEMNNDKFSLLEFLGFSTEEIHKANLVITGRACIEGAPHLKEEHLPIFDCANKNGAHGQRYISVDGHIGMMAAVQGFLSGAISKTVNLPSSATIEDIKQAYIKAWKLGLKALALFRDGSKLASVLDTAGAGESPSASKKVLGRGEREKLPPRRKGYTQRVTIGGANNILYHTTGENEDGDIREVFITGLDGETSQFRSMMNCFARAVSIALQYGAPIETLIETFTGASFAPNGPVDGHPNIRFAKSLVECIFRDIGIHYRGMKHLGHCFQTKHVEVDCDNRDEQDLADESESENKLNLHESGYTGDRCPNPSCGSFRMVRSGACSYCKDCSETTGCS